MTKEAIHLGIVGLGRGFMLTLPALRHHPNVRLVAAFDLRRDAVEAFEAEFDARGHETFESLLADPSIDAVYIATPHQLHAAQCIAALNAGKHVLVEKPMALSVPDCAAMVAAAERADRILMVGPSHGFDEPVRVAANAIASGRFGAIRMVTALNFTDFLYRPRRQEELQTAQGGGVAYSQAAHQIDVVRRLVSRPAKTVRAMTGNWDTARGSDGAYAALMTFADGVVATLTYSGYAHYDSDELLGWISELGRPKDPQLYGGARSALAALSADDEGRAKLSRTYGAPGTSMVAPAPHHEHFGFVLVSCEGADLKILPTGIEVYADKAKDFLAVAPPAYPRSAVIDEFAMAIRSGTRPLHDGHWGMQTMACCASLLESSRQALEIDISQLIKTRMETVSQ